jgi:hypothetical protein
VSQISPPIRIVLIAAIGLIAVWMLFLKPKADPVAATNTPAATAPGVTGLSNAKDQANEAAAAAAARNAKVQDATDSDNGAVTAQGPDPASAPAGEAAKRADAKDELPAPVRKAIENKKVVALLFWDPEASEDRAVKRAFSRVDHWNGAVYTRAAHVRKISRFGAITRGASVEQSPTVVVVDRNMKAEKLVGFVDTRSIDQTVLDALRNSGTLIRSAYLRQINQVCRSGGDSIFATPQPNSLGADVRRTVETYNRRGARLLTEFKGVPAPARWRGLKRASVADLKKMNALNRSFAAKVGDGTSPQAIVSAAATLSPRSAAIAKRWDARMDRHHVISCGKNF